MTEASTTIRVRVDQLERLRELAEANGTTMTATLDDALEALWRNRFYQAMADAEATLRQDPSAWVEYLAERDAWLEPDLTS